MYALGEFESPTREEIAMVGGIGRFLGRIFKAAGPKASSPTARAAAGGAPAPKAGVAANQKDTFEKLEPRAGTPPRPKDAEPPKGPPAPVRPGSAPLPSESRAASTPGPGTMGVPVETKPEEAQFQRTGGDTDLTPLDPVREWGDAPELGEGCARPGGADTEGSSEVRGKSPLSSEEEDSPPKGKGST